MLVTTYYWAFFSLMALTRVTGHSVWFLDKTALTELKKLASAQQQPGAGALYLDLGPYTSGTLRSAQLKPSKKQLHEAIWLKGHRLISDVFDRVDPDNVQEYRLWRALKMLGDKFGPDWPSKLRNAVNYRPGYCYREVTQDAQIDFIHDIKRHTPATLNQLLEYLEDEYSAIQNSADPSSDPKGFSRLLGTFAMILSAILETLHADILDRHKGDGRWKAKRAIFLSRHCKTSTKSVWPYA
jgi:hypothetical protein